MGAPLLDDEVANVRDGSLHRFPRLYSSFEARVASLTVFYFGPRHLHANFQASTSLVKGAAPLPDDG